MSLYDQFIGETRGEYFYTSESPSVVYPDSNQINVFGPLYLPRVYGKDLTAFEIASSGAVAVTLNDIHSFDLVRDNATSNVTLQTYSNDSFKIDIGETSNMFLSLQTSNTHAHLYSDSNVTVEALDTLTLKGDTVALSIGQNFDVAAKNISLTAQSNVDITGTAGHVLLSASNDSGLLSLANGGALLYGSNNLGLYSSNDLYMASETGTVITADSGLKSITLSDASSGINEVKIVSDGTFRAVSSSSATVESIASDVFISSFGGSTTIQSLQDTSLSAGNNALSVVLDADTNTIGVTSADKFTVQTVGEINMTSSTESVILRAADSNVRLELDSSTSNLTAYAVNNITINADSQLTMNSSNQASVTAGKNIELTTQSNLTVTAASNITMTSSNNVSIEAATQSLNLSAAGGAVFASFDAPTTSLTIGSSNNVSVSASNNVNIEAATQSLNLTAASGAVFASFDAPTTSLNIGSSNNISVTASNTVTISGLNLNLSSSSNLTLTGASNVFLQRDAQNYIQVKEDNTLQFFAGGANIISAFNDRLLINGNVQVTGTIDTIDITQSNLQISDKTLTLAYDSNMGALEDGPSTNSGAGIRIAGTYGGDSNARSLTWNWNTGMDKLGTTDVDGESFWDLRGGQLRISHSNASTQIAFGFRINEVGELELVKKIGTAGFKRIAKFGRNTL